MNDQPILEALQTALIAAVAASPTPTLPLKLVLRNFDQTNISKYLEAVWIPNNVTGATWGREEQFQGIFRLLLHWPNDDVGAYPALEVLKPITEQFPKGTLLPIAGGRTVQIYQNPQLVSVVETGAGSLFVVSIWYRSFQP